MCFAFWNAKCCWVMIATSLNGLAVIGPTWLSSCLFLVSYGNSISLRRSVVQRSQFWWCCSFCEMCCCRCLQPALMASCRWKIWPRHSGACFRWCGRVCRCWCGGLSCSGFDCVSEVDVRIFGCCDLDCTPPHHTRIRWLSLGSSVLPNRPAESYLSDSAHFRSSAHRSRPYSASPATCSTAPIAVVVSASYPWAPK